MYKDPDQDPLYFSINIYIYQHDHRLLVPGALLLFGGSLHIPLPRLLESFAAITETQHNNNFTRMFDYSLLLYDSFDWILRAVDLQYVSLPR